MTRRVKSFIEASSDMLDNIEKMLEESLAYLDISEQNELVDIYEQAGVRTHDAAVKVVSEFVLTELDYVTDETSIAYYMNGLPNFNLSKTELSDIIEDAVSKSDKVELVGRYIVPKED